MSNTEQVVQDRSQAYGDFTYFSELVHNLEQTCIRHMQIHNPQSLAKMQPFMIEGMHMMLHKIARIVNGDPMVEDSWRDVGGYGTLVADRVAMLNAMTMANISDNDVVDDDRKMVVPDEATLVTGGMDVPVGGVHPHEEEPRTGRMDSSEDIIPADFVPRY